MFSECKMGKLVTFILLLVTTFIQGSPSVYSGVSNENTDDMYEDYHNNNGDDDHRDTVETELMRTPDFVSVPQMIEVNMGDTVRLPCLVDRLEGFVMMWKKKEEILTVATQIIDKRVRLEEERNGNYLIIGQVNPNDTGVYTCQISAWKPTELHHNLTVRVPPEITLEPAEEMVIKSGETATLSCTATTGTPSPKLSWYKVSSHGEEDMSAHVTLDGNTARLQLRHVTRHSAGHYQCRADNGYLPVTSQVMVHVEYSPEIHVDNNVVLTSVGSEEEISCNVHAYPHASVTWMKEDKTIDNNDPGVVVTNKHHHHSLILLSMDNTTVGRYYCVASNTLGQATKSILVTGLPANVEVISERFGQLDTEYLLQWQVESESEVVEWLVMIKKDKSVLDTWDTFNLDNMLTMEEEKEDATWVSGLYKGKYLFTGLSEASVYQVKIGARNDFGWNYSDEVFVFGTKGADAIFKAAMTAGSPTVTTSMTTMISVMLVMMKMW